MATSKIHDDFLVVQNASDDAPSDLGYRPCKLAKKGQILEVYVKVFEINTGVRLDRSKTVGVISANNDDTVLMSAHSGYTAGPRRDDRCLDTAKWNNLALNHLAKRIMFAFPKNIRDSSGTRVTDEQRGRAHAGHVEVLLSTWFVVDVMRKHFDLANESEEKLITQLRRLKEASLGNYRTAYITIDNVPCRTCIHYMNRLSQHTGIAFIVYESQGIGPIQVRIDGQRRYDVVGDVFHDSEDEFMVDLELGEEGLAESNEAAVEAPLTTPTLAPSTPPSRPLLQRPRRNYWRETAAPWTPENPQELLSSYKKKTPVWEFPGYRAASRTSLTTPIANKGELELAPAHTADGYIDSDYVLIDRNMVAFKEYWQPSSPTARLPHPIPSPSAKEESEMPNQTICNDLNEWEDLGDGLMIHRAAIKNMNQKNDTPPFKQRDLHELSPEALGAHNNKSLALGVSNGLNYARTAYESVRETIEAEQPKRGPVEASRARHRRHRDSILSHRQRAPYFLGSSGLERLQDFRHEPPLNRDDESVFKGRYSILRPRQNSRH